MRFMSWIGFPLLVAAALVLSSGLPLAAQKSAPAGHEHAAHFEQCAKACTKCMRECESCAAHCAHLIANGKKEHVKTLGTCADCSEFCAAAAKIVSRGGPMTGQVCDACAKACDVCGKTCEQYSSDQHMQQCAQACRECARECRAMLQHVHHGESSTSSR